MTQSALDFIVPKTNATRARYKSGSKPSFGHFVEDYINGEVDIKGDFEDFIKARHGYFDFTLTPHHFKFFFSRFIPEVAIHSKAQDERIIRENLVQALPSLSGRLLHAETCLYTMTPDEHFVIDRHPEFPQVALAAGFSGHGFKFASVAGELLADLVTGSKSPYDLELFSIRRFAGHQ